MSGIIVRAVARLSVATAFLLSVAGLAIVSAPTAAAAPAPVIPAGATAITADRLPTVQVDGVVWSQAVVGNTVYAGGKFNNARPAGAAAGTSLTPRSNLLAYDITTGNLITSFAPTLSAQVLSVAASPDGTRVYVVGDFTTANGQARRRVAAYSTATGALITAFNPVGVTSQARAVIATNDAVYVGGGFASAGNGQARANLAAFRASDGSLLPWNPTADYTVWALGVSTDGASVFAGGGFQNVNGLPAYGLAKLGATGTGTLDSSWKPSVRNAGKDAGITSLRVQGSYVYGTTYHFGPGGNLEGTFKIPVSSGDVEWVTDCHGDNYSTFMTGGVVYSASHSHYCGNMGGGFPQYTTVNGSSAWKFQHAQAWSDTVTGDILNDVHGYPNWHGVEPGPAMVDWLPDLGIGSVTGQYQAGWSVAGNSDYVVFGGEFPTVNSVGQQGLVRFGKRPVAPAKEGPRFTGNAIVPTLVPTSTSSVRVSWPTGFDRDSYALTYKVIRNGTGGIPRYTTTVNSNWWTVSAQGFVDTGLTPGATYTYQIVTNDSDNNIVYGSSAAVTMPTSFPAANPYARSVQNNGARIYWPLNETAGPTATDRGAGPSSPAGVGVNDGRAGTSVTWGQAGAVSGDAAAALVENDTSQIYAPTTEVAPNTFSSQVWIKTTTTRGGRIIGFGDLQVGYSGHRDRQVYMDDGGHLVFGVRAEDGSNRTVASARSYNDNVWHQITATMNAQGMTLYADGVRVGRRSDTTQGEPYLGSWRLGGDNLSGWPNQPTTQNFTGSVDEVAIFPTALTPAQINATYQASGRTALTPAAPTDALGTAVYADEPDLYWRFGESTGTKANDSGKSLSDGTYRNGPTLGVVGVAPGNTAVRFDGSNQFVSSDGQVANPTVYSEEAWFSTTSVRGGKIIGFGNEQAGSSSSFDRHVYMQDDGRLVFGTYTGQVNTITTTAAYNDGTWHHVVATQSETGMKLYLDGARVGTNPQTAAQDYSGYWKIGGDRTWGSSSDYFDGTIDEVAVYPSELSAARVAAHYATVALAPNQSPGAAFTTNVTSLDVTANGSASSDPDGTIANYSWNWGDSFATSGTNPTASHTYAAAGRYTIKLTVTDDDGATDIQEHDVVVAAPNMAPTASFTAPIDHLVVSPDAAASKDVDGTIDSYAWDFGDSSTGTGKTPTHTYASPGSYPITLTVTDDDAASATTTKTVTATRPPNQLPTASFTSSTADLVLSVDATPSIDPDGTISSYAWNFGDGTTPVSGTTKARTHTYAAPGTYTVRLTVTDNDGGTAVTQTEITVEAGNESPTAAFTTSVTNLKVSVNAGGSRDPDGTIASYAWAFGDGATGSGRTDSHSYSTSGTYTVTLTVTDDDGATSVATKAVTVAAAPNAAPTARFTSTTVDLNASVDATTSSDSDGTVAAYAWNFGDSTTGSGPTVSHRYAAAGTYTVTLTVTDDAGAVDTVSHPVSVTAPTVIASDAFNRTVTSGWGSADTGGAWTTSSAVTNFGVLNGSGTMRTTTSSTLTSYLNGAAATGADLTASFGYDKPGTGGGIYTSVIARRVGTSDYRAKVRVTATDTTLYLVKTVGGTETVISSQVVSGLTSATGDELNVRFQVSGTNPTTLRARVWKAGAAEPSTWRLTSTDSTPALQAPGAVGLANYLSSTATNSPVTSRFGDFRVVPVN